METLNSIRYIQAYSFEYKELDQPHPNHTEMLV